MAAERQKEHTGFSERRILFGLALFCAILYFSGIGQMAVTDPVEVNYTETAKEMLAAGDWLSPRIYGQYWYDKPVFFYWELMAAFKLFGITDFAARFFPALFATIGVYMTYFFGKYLYNAETGATAAVILGTSLEYWYIGHAVITDMTLAVCMSASIMLFYVAYAEDKPLLLYGAFATAGIAVLTKGPVGFLLPGLILFVFLFLQRRLKFLINPHICGGFALFLLIVSFWYVPMYQLHGQAFIDTFLGTYNLLRATVAEHPKNNVFYYYLLIWAAGFFPWSLFCLPGAVHCLRQKRLSLPTGDAERLLVLWGAVVVLVFQCMASKYLTYTFPYMMPLAVGAAPYVRRHLRPYGKAVLVGMSVFYIGAAFMIAPRETKCASGKEAVPLLQSLCDENTDIVSYGIRYPATLVYYVDLPVRRLETRKDIEKCKPRSMTWTDTNAMPFMAVEDLRPDRNVLVITDIQHPEQVQRGLPGMWREVGAAGRFAFYKRIEP